MSGVGLRFNVSGRWASERCDEIDAAEEHFELMGDEIPEQVRDRRTGVDTPRSCSKRDVEATRRQLVCKAACARLFRSSVSRPTRC